MKFKREDAMDLNEQNVQKLFAYCLANDATPEENIVKANFFKKDEGVQVPDVKFDKTKVCQTTNKMIYMLGQLAAIHNGTASLLAMDGYKKYDGTMWTQNKMTLFALYYLGCAFSLLYEFTFYPSLRNYASPLNLKSHILHPTLSPNDPNFDKQTIFEKNTF